MVREVVVLEDVTIVDAEESFEYVSDISITPMEW